MFAHLLITDESEAFREEGVALCNQGPPLFLHCLERQAYTLYREERITQCKDPSKFIVEDNDEGSLGGVYIVRRDERGQFSCRGERGKCLMQNSIYNGILCQHSLAVAETLGELTDHVQFVNGWYSKQKSGYVFKFNPYEPW